jgi:hypothetical protein
MSLNGTGMFDPFSRHRNKTESQPEPVQVQPIAEAAGIDRKSTEVHPSTETCPPTKPVEAPVARTNKVFDPFSSHAGKKERRPGPVRTQVPPAQRLMAWLPRWPKATISVRDVRLYGPNSLRDPKIASGAIEILASYGWLVPVMTRRHDSKWWEIVRGRDPTVASSSVAGL